MPTLTYVAKNVSLHDAQYTHSVFLAELAPSVYTVCRTLSQTHIANYRSHLRRTARSVVLLLLEQKGAKNTNGEQLPKDNNAEQTNNAEQLPTEESLLPVVEQQLDVLLKSDLSCLIKLCQTHMKDVAEFRFTVYVKSISPLSCSYHAEPLPQTALSPVDLSCWDFRGRDNPQVKSSSWLESPDRVRMEQSVCGKVNEAIMYDDDGFVLEGISSNAYAVFEGKVFTAPLTKVLNGTMRILVSKACAKLNIPFVETSPNINQFDKWEALFVSSSSRLILEGDKVHFYTPTGELAETKRLPYGGKVFTLLEKEIKEMVQAEAEKIL